MKRKKLPLQPSDNEEFEGKDDEQHVCQCHDEYY